MTNAATHFADLYIAAADAAHYADAEAELLAHAEPITGWHALAGLPIGSRPVRHPDGRITQVEVRVGHVIEHAAELAIADRVAYVLASRTGATHVVLATHDAFLVATIDDAWFNWTAAVETAPFEHAPRFVSVATADGVMPVLTALPA